MDWRRCSSWLLIELRWGYCQCTRFNVQFGLDCSTDSLVSLDCIFHVILPLPLLSLLFVVYIVPLLSLSESAYLSLQLGASTLPSAFNLKAEI